MRLARIKAVTWRVTRQVLRDRRLLVLALGVPIAVMSILAPIVRSDPPSARVLVIAEGTLELFVDGILDRLEQSGLILVDLDPTKSDQALRSGEIDALLRFKEGFLESRAEGERGRIEVRVEGVEPHRLAGVVRALSDSMADIVHEMPVFMPVGCPDECGELSSTPPPMVEITRLVGERDELDYYISGVAPLIAFFFGYLITAMAFLRERTGGTLERISATALRPLELTIGYFLGFLSVAISQAAVVLVFMVWVIGIANAGSWWPLIALLLFTAVCAEGLGVFLSTLARSEFQVVQFIPLVILPQVFLCGLIWPLEQIPDGLRHLAYLMPLTYAVDAIRDIMIRGDTLRALPDLAAVAIYAAASALLAALTMRQKPY